jgi:hypothetical protein
MSPMVSYKVQPHHTLGLPRRQEVTLNRLRLNHAYINNYKRRKGMRDDATCRLCEDPDESVNHVVLECPNTISVAEMRRHTARITRQEMKEVTVQDTIGTKTFGRLKDSRHRTKFVGALTKTLDFIATQFLP